MVIEKVTAIVQARMGSTRCPGKSMELLKGTPVIEVVIKRLSRAKRVENIVLATTTLLQDTVLAKTAKQIGVAVFRGDENDVAARCLKAADQFANGRNIVKVSADNVFIDWDEIDRAIDAGISGGYDYVGFDNEAYPDRISDFSGEFMRLESLRKLTRLTRDPYDREHVYPFFCSTPDVFKSKRIQTDPQLYSTLKLDLDYPEDLQIIQRISDEIDDPCTTPSKEIVAIANRLMNVELLQFQT